MNEAERTKTPSTVFHLLFTCLSPLTQSVCLLADLNMRIPEVAFIGPVSHGQVSQLVCQNGCRFFLGQGAQL